MDIMLADGTKLTCYDKPLAEGASGVVFDTAGTHVVKLYKQADQQLKNSLEKIVGPEYSVVLGEPYWKGLFAWPEAIIVYPTLGILMPRAPKGMDKLHWFLASKQRSVYAKKHGVAKIGQWKNYLEMAIQMARVVRRMHFRGLCHSDLSFNNFLVDPAKSQIILIDCDGLVVPGFAPPQVVGTQMCMAPELMSQFTTPGTRVDPSSATDLHALATLIYWLLFSRHPLKGPKFHDPDPARDEELALGEKALFIEHPHDLSNRPQGLNVSYKMLLTPAVQKLIERAFVDGLHAPHKRPSAADWERFLGRMVDAMIPCPKNCFLGAFVLDPKQPLAKCPSCGTPLKGPSHIPILNFYKPGRGQKGHFQNDLGYFMAGWHERTLHAWHVDPSQQPGPGVDDRPVASFEYDGRRSKWFFHNRDIAEVTLLDRIGGSQQLHPGKNVEVTDGVRLLLGPPDQCRLAHVQMLKLK